MLHRLGLVHARMTFWRVVVEGRLNRSARRWPAHAEGAVMAVFVWARSIEEAEGLASLAAEDEGLDALTSDAKKAPPAASPKIEPGAVARGEIRFLPRIDGDTRTDPPSRRGARA
jgi:hypothetical protein